MRTVRSRLALALPVAVAAMMVLARIDQEGFGNEYYAAAVRSMLLGPRNFFFAAFDPAGFLAVDKPPVGLWIQALSAAIFGFQGWSLILPQALSAVASVALLYRMLERDFGWQAGWMAAMTLALTPISVATARNNTMDSQLVLVCLLAAWAARRAADSGRLRWLLASAALLGLGFNIKMAQALLVLPAIYALYLLASSHRLHVRLTHLALATALWLVLSLSWAVAVDLTPATSRPYVASTQTNSVLELIVGHNAAARLGLNVSDGSLSAATQPSTAPPTPPQRETGDPGAWRLFDKELAGQASWLLPTALLGAVFVAASARWRGGMSGQARGVLLWIAWLAPIAGFVSVAGLMHRYYLSMLAPPIAALVGAGLAVCRARSQHAAWRIASSSLLAVSAASAILLLGHWPEWQARLSLPLAALAVLGITLTVLPQPPSGRRWMASWLQWPATAALLLLAPAIWSAFPVRYGGDPHLPYADPDLAGLPSPGRTSGTPLPIVDQLVMRSQGEPFLAATLDANAAAPLILATGKPIMAFGGFTGSDPILTPEALSSRVAAGQVRMFWIPAPTPPGVPPSGERAENSPVLEWVYTNCAAVRPETDGPQAPLGAAPPVQPAIPAAPGAGGGQVDLRLYDCRAVPQASGPA